LLSADTIQFTIDDNDNIYAANSYKPVIRKYSIDGKLLLAITYETFIKIPPIKITLNSRGDEIKITDKNETNVKVIKRGKNTQIKGKRRIGVCLGIGTDPQERIYTVARRRLFTEKEQKAAAIGCSFNRIYRERMDFDVIDKLKDIYSLLVFNQYGKLVAEATVPNLGTEILVNGKQIFFVDGDYYQRIMEYEMIFEAGGGEKE
jgi:hypothetical protein